MIDPRRRALAPQLLIFALALLLPLAGRGEDASTQPRAVAAIGMTVSDLDRSVAFYREVLDFEPIAEGEGESEIELTGDPWEHLLGVFGLRARVARLRLGEEEIELTEFLTPRGRPLPTDSRSNDRWFQHIAIVTSDMPSAYARLREHRVEHVSPGPQRLPDWNPAAGGIMAFYFRDPDDHALEVLAFPAGKGLAKWRRDDRLFLGIDHTAITVADTEASLAFYRNLLGFEVAGASENWGPEQERLNLVFGARLAITALRLPSGPGVELLEYLTPRGRPMPHDEAANDLFHWHTTVVAPQLAPLARSLREARVVFVSAGVVETPERSLGFVRGLLVRDPDGHVVELVQP